MNIDDLTKNFNNCAIVDPKVVAINAIEKDIIALVPYYVNNLEPHLSCEYNEFFDDPNFNSDIYKSILENEYQLVSNLFIKHVKGQKNLHQWLYVNQNDINAYIDYYIDIALKIC